MRRARVRRATLGAEAETKKRRDRGPSDRGNNKEEGRPGERDVSRNERHLGLAFVERRACVCALVLGQWNKELSACSVPFIPLPSVEQRNEQSHKSDDNIELYWATALGRALGIDDTA